MRLLSRYMWPATEIQAGSQRDQDLQIMQKALLEATRLRQEAEWRLVTSLWVGLQRFTRRKSRHNNASIKPSKVIS